MDAAGPAAVTAPLPAEEDLVFATDGEESVGAGSEDQEDLGAFGLWDLVRMVLVLLLVVAAVYGLITVLRRRIDRPEHAEESPITVLASRSLGSNRDLHVVMIGRRVLVLGGGDGGVSLVSTIEDQETIDELVLAHSTAGAGDGRRTFGSVLGQWLGNLAVPGNAATGDSDQKGVAFGGGFLRAQHDRVRRMR